MRKPDRLPAEGDLQVALEGKGVRGYGQYPRRISIRNRSGQRLRFSLHVAPVSHRVSLSDETLDLQT